MKWLDTSTENCSIQRALDVLGEKWTLLIVRDAVNGVRRFDDFRRHVGLSEAVLADRLRKLLDAGVLETRPYREPGRRTRRDYHLTAKGWDLYPALIALMQWGDKYAADAEGPPVEVRHRGCGAPVEAVVRCSAEHRAVGPREAEVRPGPAARPAPTAGPAARPVATSGPGGASQPDATLRR
ncbi:helix-turn-helix domain-containing protein [Actinomadura alba]|uniref:winged helix-turn-helix transcriptional regulator n=1 Tax=Actinomadura alba TaxID=406431 RepID=UPI0031CE1DA2